MPDSKISYQLLNYYLMTQNYIPIIKGQYVGVRVDILYCDPNKYT